MEEDLIEGVATEEVDSDMDVASLSNGIGASPEISSKTSSEETNKRESHSINIIKANLNPQSSSQSSAISSQVSSHPPPTEYIPSSEYKITLQIPQSLGTNATHSLNPLASPKPAHAHQPPPR